MTRTTTRTTRTTATGPRSTATRRQVVSLAVAAAAVLCAFSAYADQASIRWTGAWSAAVQAPLGPPATFDHVTLRQVVHIRVGGRMVRVRFSNAQGTEPLVIGAASVGVRSSGAAVRPRSLRILTFAGAGSISVAPGGVAITDPVFLDVDALDDLAISLYMPSPQLGTTQLSLVHPTSYVSPAGNFTEAADMAVATTIAGWYWLSGVDVAGEPRMRAV